MCLSELYFYVFVWQMQIICCIESAFSNCKWLIFNGNIPLIHLLKRDVPMSVSRTDPKAQIKACSSGNGMTWSQKPIVL